MIGRLLNKRYEILEKIGSGGMALVYKARDNFLNRIVAVKILRDEYADNEVFLDRFKQEAQAVASLSHTNIVNIYDVGTDGEKYYIVMEYVEGSNLKEIIKQEAPMESSKALRISIQICSALEHAHQNSIIHRDIKPHNILFTSEGQIKVTDFGIARAATENSATVSFTDSSSFVGSVHYISPEQANGEITDFKSDIYSLGVILFEMITGELPFSGENPISIALQHVHNQPPVIENLNSEVPEIVQDIIENMLSKNPEERPDIIRLKESLISASKTLKGYPRRRHKFFKDKNFKLNRTGWVLAAVFVLGLFLISYFGLNNFLYVEEVKVPNITGVHISEAEEILKEEGLRYTITNERHHRTVEEDYVIRQEPQADSMIKRNRAVNVEVSLGPELFAVPDVTGETLRSARIKIMNSKFTFNDNVTEIYDSEVSSGRIIKQIPEPDELMPEGTEIELVISKGSKPEKIEMPNLIGLSLFEAESKLENAKINIGEITYESSESYFNGQVIKQDVAVGKEILQDSTVNLVVSKGPGPNPENETVRLRIGGSSDTYQIIIVVEDLKGESEVYSKEHKPGDLLEKRVQYYGEGIIKVYQNGELIEKIAVP